MASMSTPYSQGLIYAGLAGGMGALASVGAKLALSAGEALHDVCVNLLANSELRLDVHCETVSSSIRWMSAGLIVLANVLMWLLFTKSLTLCQSSVEASITNTASNFFTSGVFGWMLFSERLPLTWWFGASLIILGVLLISKGSKQLTEEGSASMFKEKTN